MTRSAKPAAPPTFSSGCATGRVHNGRSQRRSISALQCVRSSRCWRAKLPGAPSSSSRTCRPSRSASSPIQLELEQVIFNLLRNAFEAVSDQSGPRDVRIALSETDGVARLDIADNGPGVPSELVPKLFTPSSPPPGPKAPVLELALSQRSHRTGRRRDCLCPAGSGRTLPGDAASGKGRCKSMTQPVYLVEDDEAVRNALSLLLSTIGLSVKGFGDPTAFLGQLLRLEPGCLILDIRMPAISGLKLQEQLLSQGVDWPTIVISGHGDIEACRRAFRNGAVDFPQPVDEQGSDRVAIQRAQQVLDRNLGAEALRAETLALLSALTPARRRCLSALRRGFRRARSPKASAFPRAPWTATAPPSGSNWAPRRGRDDASLARSVRALSSSTETGASSTDSSKPSRRLGFPHHQRRGNHHASHPRSERHAAGPHRHFRAGPADRSLPAA